MVKDTMISNEEKTFSTTSDSIESSMNESSAADGSCSCCSGDISQPTDPSLLQKTEKVYGSGGHINKCRFLAKWFEDYKWLHLCSKSLKVYCFYCRVALRSQVSVMSTKADPAFSTTTGFSNWKKGTSSFKQHESSLAHRDALSAHIMSSVTPINELLKDCGNLTQKNRRQSFLNQLAGIRFLVRQGISVRNDHSSGSNLTILLKQVLGECNWVKENKYQSPEVINELIKLMANKVLFALLSDVHKNRWFSILADETRDISNREQLTITLRTVSESYEIKEDLFGLAQLDETTAEHIHLIIKDCLLRLGIPIANCRGQAYDGAANFQGCINGVAKKKLRMKTQQQFLFIAWLIV